MQPHSMCAVALAGYMWNHPRRIAVERCNMNVEYIRNSKWCLNKYELLDIEESSDGRGVKVRIMRGGGGIACTMTIRRKSIEEGAEVEMTHSQIHVAGLREVFKLYKMRITEGAHYNSQRYRNFFGEFMDSTRTKLRLRCEVIQADKSFVSVQYDLEIKQVYLLNT